MKRELMRVSIAARLVREIGGVLCTRPAKVNWPGGVRGAAALLHVGVPPVSTPI